MASYALSLDTSTPVLSCALLERLPGALRLAAIREAGPPQVTSTLVPGAFDELLEEAGARQDEIDVLVSGLGPGLFTGARVAVATMKAVAFARSRPLVGAESLESLSLAAARGAFQVGDTRRLSEPVSSGLLCPVLDARKGEVYFALYRFRDGVAECVLAPRAGSAAELVQVLEALSEPVELFGTGAAPAQSVALPPHVTVRESPRTPSAADIALVALSRTPEPAFDLASVLALEPHYLRPPEAEIARRKREAEKAGGGG